MFFGCCITIDQYDTLVEAGYKEITLAGTDITAYSEEEFQKVKRTIKNGPLKTLSINSYCPDDIRLHGPGFSADIVREYTEKLCSRGHELGYKYVGIGAPKNKMILPGESRETADKDFEVAIRTMCEVAARYQMDILMESITSLSTNYLNTTKECYALVKKLHLPNFHLVYDIYHEWCEGQGPELIALYADEIRTVHLSNLEKGKRSYLKESDIPLYRSYFQALEKAGYQGEFNIECFEKDPAEKIKASMKVLQAL